MGNRVQGVIKDDDLFEWGEELIDDHEYRNWGHLIEKAVSELRKQEADYRY